MTTERTAALPTRDEIWNGRSARNAFPVALVADAGTAASFFSAAFYGRNDVTYLDHLKIPDIVLVDIDQDKLATMAKIYPTVTETFAEDAFEVAARLRDRGRVFDVVLCDPYDGLSWPVLGPHFDRFAALARRLWITGVSLATLEAHGIVATRDGVQTWLDGHGRAAWEAVWLEVRNLNTGVAWLGLRRRPESVMSLAAPVSADAQAAKIEVVPVQFRDPLLREAFDKVLVPSAPPWLGPPSFEAMANGEDVAHVLLYDGEPLAMTSGDWLEPFGVFLCDLPRGGTGHPRSWPRLSGLRPGFGLLVDDLPTLHGPCRSRDAGRPPRDRRARGPHQAGSFPRPSRRSRRGRAVFPALVGRRAPPKPDHAGVLPPRCQPRRTVAGHDCARSAPRLHCGLPAPSRGPGMPSDPATTALLDALSVPSGVRMIDMEEVGSRT